MTPSQDGQGLVFSSTISSLLEACEQKLTFVIDRELQIERALIDNGFVTIVPLLRVVVRRGALVEVGRISKRMDHRHHGRRVHPKRRSIRSRHLGPVQRRRTRERGLDGGQIVSEAALLCHANLVQHRLLHVKFQGGTLKAVGARPRGTALYLRCAPTEPPIGGSGGGARTASCEDDPTPPPEPCMRFSTHTALHPV